MSSTPGERLRWWQSDVVHVQPDRSDPDYRWMRAQGAYYPMKRHGSNSAAINALLERMSAALDTLRSLAWQVEEPTRDEVAAISAVFEEDAWRDAAKDVVWTEPKAPRFDANGNPVAT